jgi:hypothetical protein
VEITPSERLKEIDDLRLSFRIRKGIRMELKEILPFLIPGILFQLSMQVFYIIKCLTDLSLTPVNRSMYAIMIAVFNLPAAAVYLFKSDGKKSSDAIPDEIDNVSPNIRRGIFLLMVLTR